MRPARGGHRHPARALSSCPPISLSVRRVDVTGDLTRTPTTIAALQCQTSSGAVFDPVTMRMWSAETAAGGVYSFDLDTPVATLGCGDAVACKLSLVPGTAVSGRETQVLIPWSVSSCWFLYSQFQQQGGNLWACRANGGAQYVLQCANCTGSAARARGSDSDDEAGSYAVSPTVLIIVLCVGAVAAVSIFLAILVYARAARRTGRRNERLSALRVPGAPEKPVPMFFAASDGPCAGNLPSDGQAVRVWGGRRGV